ncbi:MAG TPA: quinolinate synthase NadA [Bryobacteraceae bacterium]|nr:quinolinate synthase NadA [Bryobacteraceae bacterium]HOQ44695.1 quinolinate synthase NadA [Bryobacteraceae bacterium]HPQ14695.1 quinolinate synthase NadA [Bryobacteraceae bacterium]HPU71905.1 quinolinate synthase NadA [Bryobacteraceae bacterium]
MPASLSVQDEILQLKRDRRAILLAHHYQEAEIQDLADCVGDSLELARRAREFDGDVIAFCGVWFMAETAKVLNPGRIVVVPDREASCSLVESCPVEPIRAYRQRHPDHVIVSYINTSVEVKAESDILCTSRNAVQVVNSIPPEKHILFLPDRNLGNYVQRMTGRKNMSIWQGTCVVHATFAARRLAAARMEHPNALVAAHPECPPEVLEQADFVGSTTAIIKYCVETKGDEFIVMTESGVAHSLKRLAPEKRFYFLPNDNCNCSECPYMKRNTLEKLRDCLQNLEPRVEVSEDLMRRALVPLERMLAIQ